MPMHHGRLPRNRTVFDVVYITHRYVQLLYV
jgi:hypothetical protein